MKRSKIIALVVGILLAICSAYLYFGDHFQLKIINDGGYSRLLVPWECPPNINCAHPTPPYLSYNYPTTVTQSSSAVISVTAEFYYAPKLCKIETGVSYRASALAAGLDVVPNVSIETTKYPQSHSEAVESWTWVIHPQETGNYIVIIDVLVENKECTFIRDKITLDIEVVNLFGLNAKQAKIAGGFSGVLGILLTTPFFSALREKFFQKKKQNTAKNKAKLIISSDGNFKEIDVDDDQESKNKR
jgi:hypothetical protein